MTRKFRVLAAALGAAGLLAVLLTQAAYAGPLSSVSLTMSDSRPGAAASTHQFGFTPAATTTILGVKIEYCLSAGGDCTTPTGLATTGSTVAANLLDGTSNAFSGWDIDMPANGVIEVTNSSGVTGANPATIAISGITNAGDAADVTSTIFYVRVTTYSSDTALTEANEIDDGALASAFVPQVTVTARQDAMLNLTVAAVNESTTIGSGQDTTGGSTPTALAFGIFKPIGTANAAPLFLAHDLTVSTNTAGGYSVSVASGGENAMALGDGSSSIEYVGADTTWDDAATVGFGVTAKDGGAPAGFSDGLSYFPAPASDSLVVAEHGSPISAQTTKVAYRVQVESTLLQGDYEGTLTYTLLTNF